MFPAHQGFPVAGVIDRVEMPLDFRMKREIVGQNAVTNIVLIYTPAAIGERAIGSRNLIRGPIQNIESFAGTRPAPEHPFGPELIISTG